MQITNLLRRLPNLITLRVTGIYSCATFHNTGLFAGINHCLPSPGELDLGQPFGMGLSELPQVLKQIPSLHHLTIRPSVSYSALRPTFPSNITDVTLADIMFDGGCFDILTHFSGLERLTLKGGFNGENIGCLAEILAQYATKIAGLSLRLNQICALEFMHTVIDHVLGTPLPRLSALLLESKYMTEAIPRLCKCASLPMLRFLSLRAFTGYVSLADGKALLAHTQVCHSCKRLRSKHLQQAMVCSLRVDVLVERRSYSTAPAQARNFGRFHHMNLNQDCHMQRAQALN